MAEATAVFSVVKDLTLSGAAIFVLWGGYKGWWVYGWAYRTLMEDRDQWKHDAKELSELLKIAVAQAEKRSERKKAG